MSTPPSIYSKMISPRSRRLRTVGMVLLLGILIMTLYGYFGLMPMLARTLHQPGASSTQTHVVPETGAGTAASDHLTRRERVGKLMVAIALAYWGVCALLLLGVVVVAWLDLREVTRTYAAERRAIWNETADSVTRRDDTG